MTYKAHIPTGEVSLADHDPGATEDWKKEDAKSRAKELRENLQEYQKRLYAEGKQSLLVVFQAMDAGGKDSTIRRVFEGVNPQGVKVASFKRPTELELSHDFLWRVHQQVPATGYIGVFNRSHYEDVLIARVNQLAQPDEIEARYEHINDFERLIATNNTRILKFFLYISKEEQRERFQDRLDDPTKHWKFSLGDLPVRQQWDDYMRAFEIALTRCNTPHAPWVIVPANRKWYRDLIVLQAINATLEEMNPQYPPPEDDLSGVTIPD